MAPILESLHATLVYGPKVFYFQGMYVMEVLGEGASLAVKPTHYSKC